MKVIVVFISLLIILAKANNDQCQCDKGYLFNYKNFECVKFPTEGKTGYVKNCLDYNWKNNHPGEFQCNYCEPSFRRNDQHCEATNLEGCTNFQQKQNHNNNEQTLKQRFLNEKEYVCTECSRNQYYLKEGECVSNPTSGNEENIENCEQFQYSRDQSKLQCQQCQQGFYVNEDRTCTSNPTDQIPNCEQFQYDQQDQEVKCQQCEMGYFQGENKHCLKISDTISNCISANYNNNENQCQNCQQGFYQSMDQKECEENPKEGTDNYIQDCERYQYNNQELKCYQCKQGMVVSQNNKNCETLKSDHEVNNCQVYKAYQNDKQACVQCEDNYGAVYEYHNNNNNNNHDNNNNNNDHNNNGQIKECKKCPKQSGNSMINQFGLMLSVLLYILSV